jgi:hypothetical protein
MTQKKIFRFIRTHKTKSDFEVNKLKEKACLEAGFNFEFMVFDDKGNLID